MNISQKFKKLEPNHNYFDKINTELKAYLLGFFIADGCLTVDYKQSKKRKPCYRVSIGNSIDDIEVIKKFKEEICPLRNLEHINCQLGARHRKRQVKIRWTSEHMHKSLKEIYNIKPQKTKDLTFSFPLETVQDNLINHFVRGLFDGDGSITFHQVKNTFNNSSIQFNFSFIFTSRFFTEQIASIIEKIDVGIIRTVREIKSKNMTLYQLRFNCNRKRF